jgi:hypothetical protein
LLDCARDRLRRAFDIDAECGEHVGGARPRGDRAVAVLGNGDARAGDDEGGAGRDIVRALGVAARAAGVDGAFRRAHRDRAGSERTGRARDLFHRLAADAKPHQEGADLRFGRAAGHDEPERFGGFALAERRAVGHAGDNGTEIGKLGHARG